MSFCPKCKSEYRKEFFKCADCGEKLVYSLPKEPEHAQVPGDSVKPDKFERVLTANSESDISFIRSLLNTTDIVYFFQSRAYRMIHPEQAPAYLMVEKSKVREVRELLKDLV